MKYEWEKDTHGQIQKLKSHQHELWKPNVYKRMQCFFSTLTFSAVRDWLTILRWWIQSWSSAMISLLPNRGNLSLFKNAGLPQFKDPDELISCTNSGSYSHLYISVVHIWSVNNFGKMSFSVWMLIIHIMILKGTYDLVWVWFILSLFGGLLHLIFCPYLPIQTHTQRQMLSWLSIHLS